MPPRRRTQLANTLKEAAALPEEVTTHPQGRALSGSHLGNYRVRVGTYRAIFCLQDDGRGQEEIY